MSCGNFVRGTTILPFIGDGSQSNAHTRQEDVWFHGLKRSFFLCVYQVCA